MKRSLKFLAIPAGTAAAIGVGAIAWAYFPSSGTGSAAAAVATLTAPAAPTVEQIGASPDVKVTWNLVASPDGDPTHVGHHIRRDGTTDVCGSTFLLQLPGLAEPALTMNCTDTNVPVGDHSYTVTALFATGSWTAVSPSNSVTVNQAPEITSANSTTFTVGSAGTFTVTATGFPAPTLSMTGALPTGVSFNVATGVLSGTPGAGTGGTYPVTLTASNTADSVDQSFTLTVNQAPAITSANSAVFTVGTARTFTVTATGFPSPTLSRTGTLPSGISFDATTGVLSGAPAAGTAGTYTQTFTAMNGVGSSATQTFTLTVGATPCSSSTKSITPTSNTLRAGAKLNNDMTISVTTVGSYCGTPTVKISGGSVPAIYASASNMTSDGGNSWTFAIDKNRLSWDAGTKTVTIGFADTATTFLTFNVS